MPDNIGTRTEELCRLTPEERPHMLYYLVDATQEEYNATRGIRPTVSKCYCPECEKLVDVGPFKLDGFSASNGEVYLNKIPGEIESTECPDCHSGARFAVLMAVEKDGRHSWHIPETITDKTVSAVKSPGGKLLRVVDATRLGSCEILKDDMEPRVTRTTLTETLDLRSRDMFLRVEAERLDPETGEFIQDEPMDSALDNTLKYSGGDTMSHASKYGMAKAKPPIMRMGLQPSRTMSELLNGAERTTYAPGEETYYTMLSGPSGAKYATDSGTFGAKNLPALQRGMNYAKLKAICAGMDVDSDFRDLAACKLVQAKPKPGYNDDAKLMDDELMHMMADLMVRYPVAYQYAEERARARSMDYKYAEERKAKAEGRPHEAGPAPDALRRKLFRDEVVHVATQLKYADDAVLDEIRKSTSVPDMLAHLKFYAMGAVDGAEAPRALRLDGGKTKRDPVQPTKRLKSMFEKEPIATASNMRTLHKLGMNNTDYANVLLDKSAQYMSTELRRMRIKGENVLAPAKSLPYVKAGVICPIRGSMAYKFMKCYARTHAPASVLEAFYTSTDANPDDPMLGFNLLTETIGLFESVRSKAELVSVENAEEFVHSTRKYQLREYLKHRDLRSAYLDFIDVYGDETYEKINALAAEIAQDVKGADLVAVAKAEGVMVAVAKYPERFLGHTDYEAIVKGLEKDTQKSQTLYLTTRNGKDLFKDRSLREIHDELSIMATKVVGENKPIEYEQKFLDLEARYPIPGEPEGSDKTYGFHLMHETHDFVRTATALHNCVAGGTYCEMAQKGSRAILYMTDETDRKIACIELKPVPGRDGPRWKCLQFQGDHDSALPTQYADVALKWMDEHGVDYEGCSDVEKFGTGKYFYGGPEADYHDAEIDEASGAKMGKHDLETLTRKRTQMAIAAYGADSDGNVLLPEVPAGLDVPKF